MPIDDIKMEMIEGNLSVSRRKFRNETLERQKNMVIAANDLEDFYSYLRGYCRTLRFDYYGWRSGRCLQNVTEAMQRLYAGETVTLTPYKVMSAAIYRLFDNDGDIAECTDRLLARR